MKNKRYVIHNPPYGNYPNECSFCKESGLVVESLFIGITGKTICPECVGDVRKLMKDGEAA